MRITDADDLSHGDVARIARITVVAALRGGVFTTRQKKAIDRITEQAKKREAKKRNGK
jgi:hypothetical protein